MSRPADPRPTRRDVLRWSAAGTAATLLGLQTACSSDAPDAGRTAPTTTTEPQHRSKVPPERRRLVVIELGGGNDGLSNLAPVEAGRLYDARPTLATRPDEVFGVVDGYGFRNDLKRLHEQGLTTLVGVGDHHPSMSHFDMLARWWRGTPGAANTGGAGFLGRLSDRVARQGVVAGISIGAMPSATMSEARHTANLLTDHSLVLLPQAPATDRQAFRDAIAQFSRPADGRPEAYRTGLETLLQLDDSLREVHAKTSYGVVGPDVTAEATRIAHDLELASAIFSADVGIQVVHVAASIDGYDTHIEHRRDHAQMWSNLLPGLEAFRDDLEAKGMTDEVMICTTSEFGRRLAEHDGGLDHGAASLAFVMGPTKPGIVGEHPSLSKLDDDGNQIATVSFQRYLATMAAWLDVDPASVLEGKPQPIDRLLEV